MSRWMFLFCRLSPLYVLAALGACSVLPRAASVVDPRAVYVWPLAQCPSQPVIAPLATEPPRAALLPALGALSSLLASDVVQGFTGAIGSALKAAADADKTGYSVAGTNARYFFRLATAADGERMAIAPGCYVLAYTRLDAAASPWCDNPAFAHPMHASCSPDGRSVIETLIPEPAQPDESGAPDTARASSATAPSSATLALPDLYAEIAMQPSGASGITRPRVIALYYPRALLDSTSTKPRTLALGIVPMSFDDKWKPSAIAVYLAGIEPGAFTSAALTTAQSAWSYAPPIPPAVDLTTLAQGHAIYPVNFAASVREVGEPGRFLAAFASAFAGDSGDYSRELSAGFLPAAQQTRADAVADAQSRRADALKALAAYFGACAGRIGSASGYANAQQKTTDLDQWRASIIAARLQANSAASVAGQPRPFGDPQQIPACP